MYEAYSSTSISRIFVHLKFLIGILCDDLMIKSIHRPKCGLDSSHVNYVCCLDFTLLL